MSKSTTNSRPYGPDFARAQAIASAQIEGFSVGNDQQNFDAWRCEEISGSEFRAREIAKATQRNHGDSLSTADC